jgi:hypothetical protein
MELELLCRSAPPFYSTRQKEGGAYTVCMKYEELQNRYSSPVIVRVIKYRRMRWVGHGTRLGEMANAYKVLTVKREGKS